MKRFRQKMADIFCAVFRHSHLATNWMGYKDCARCGARMGDTLAGIGLPVPPFYGLGQSCNCSKCWESFSSLNWIDTFLVREQATWPKYNDDGLAVVKAKACETVRVPSGTPLTGITFEEA